MLLRLPAARAALLLCGITPLATQAAEVPAPVETVNAGELSEVTIIGTLEETLPQTLGLLGSRVDVISGEQVKKGGYDDVSQAMQALAPGMYITPLSGPFDYVELSFQGSRNSEMVWLVDGMRLNNRLYSTTTPLDTIPAHLVERIEVLEGGQALFFGTQAVAGAVNIVTPQFTTEPHGHVGLGLDTNDGKHANGLFSTSIGDHRFVLFASKDKAEGFRPFPEADYEPSSTDRKRGYDVTNFGPQVRLRLRRHRAYQLRLPAHRCNAGLRTADLHCESHQRPERGSAHRESRYFLRRSPGLLCQGLLPRLGHAL